MARTYIVKRGDTLRKIAKARLGDAGLYLRIAEFNGLRDPNRLSVGQHLEIPSRRSLRAPAARARRAALSTSTVLKRSGNKLSTHAWGIAIDLNPETNGMGRKGDMAPGIVRIFESFGFTWGGRWSGRGKDPMHFQFCSGY